MTTRIFPTREDSDGVSIYAADGTAILDELEVWTLGSAWLTAETEAERSLRR